jgi:hypothetical protein
VRETTKWRNSTSSTAEKLLQQLQQHNIDQHQQDPSPSGDLAPDEFARLLQLMGSEVTCCHSNCLLYCMQYQGAEVI